MEIRVLQYFLAIAREESISKAAEYLHITQPTLSRQIKDLEDEFGKQLFIRGNRKISLTEEGMLFRKRAEEIVSLVEKTESEMTMNDHRLEGDIYIGAGETEGMRIVASLIHKMQLDYPLVHFHIYSGNAQTVTERLDRGLLDFGIVIEPVDKTKYDFIKLAAQDIWGVLMRKDSPFAAKEAIEQSDLRKMNLISSDQTMFKNELAGWLGGNQRKLNITSTYNLIYNASLMVEENCGYCLGLKGLIYTGNESALCFKPLKPKLEVGLSLVWKKYQVFSKCAEYFLNLIQEDLSE